MKLVLIEAGAEQHPGALLPTGFILDLTALGNRLAPATGALPKTVEGLLTPERLIEVGKLVRQVTSDERLCQELREAGILLPREAVRLLAPLPNPRMVLSSGAAYRDHLKEMAVEGHAVPSAFIKCNASITGPHDPIVLPATAPDMVDWEGEFSCVIGTKCYQVTVEEAMDHVAGYTLINDVSARDWVTSFLTPGAPMQVFQRGGLNIMGKQFPTFCPMGPCIATKDELPDPSNVTLTTRVNGEVMQQAHTSDLMFTVAQTISYFSQWYEFLPGDIITTGTPAGVGFGRKPPRFLRPGDVVEVSVDEIGSMRNTVVATRQHAVRGEGGLA